MIAEIDAADVYTLGRVVTPTADSIAIGRDGLYRSSDMGGRVLKMESVLTSDISSWIVSTRERLLGSADAVRTAVHGATPGAVARVPGID